MKSKKKQSGSVKIDPEIYQLISDYCKNSGRNISFFVTETMKKKMESVLSLKIQ